MSNLAIFASGSGSNAENIIQYFNGNAPGKTKVVVLLANKSDAYALERARKFNVETLVFDRDTFYNTMNILDYLKSKDVNYIILAGFLWLVPEYLIDAYPDRIINIHPALLPKYGGKGMYGMNVHRAVKEAGEKETGITIHYINGEYDKGSVIFQKRCAVLNTDMPEDIAAKIHELEQDNFPRVIEKVINGECNIKK
ncbi:MAG: phosphoribosylglycinamide formyltransferase [Prevotellaceae bacterium]|jgi:phosphoribosylglycinamide formyltransferase-1|nr:phosphoribosylglycinamide formyltransferase [Prevotellaceae bacterium]